MPISINDHPFEVDTLDAVERGGIAGVATTHPIPDADELRRVQASVLSYNPDATSSLHYIPIARILTPTGGTESELTGREVRNAETAIESARELAADVYEHPGSYKHRNQ